MWNLQTAWTTGSYVLGHMDHVFQCIMVRVVSKLASYDVYIGHMI